MNRLRFIFLFHVLTTNSRGDFIDDFSMRWIKNEGFTGCEDGENQCVYSDAMNIRHDVFPDIDFDEDELKPQHSLELSLIRNTESNKCFNEKCCN